MRKHSLVAHAHLGHESMSALFGVCLTAIMILVAAHGCGENDESRGVTNMHDLMPDEMAGWKAESDGETYDTIGIFRYMNGAGEIYRLYSYREMVVRRYMRDGMPEITVEVFDMTTSEDAYGVFSHSRENEVDHPGNGAEYRSGLLSFWKDRFYVSIMAEKETPESKAAIYQFAEAIERNIAAVGEKPDILRLLPPDGLDTNSIRYFHLYTSLNYHYYVADDNILELDRDTEAVLATYKPGGHYLLYIMYPNADRAAQAYRNFLISYIPDASDSGTSQTENSKWVTAMIERNYVIVVFDAEDEEAAIQLMSNVIGNR